MRLIESNISPNFKASGGRTPLTETVAMGMPKVTESLVRHGADVNLTDGAGVSPLMYASWYCAKPSVLLFIHKGADVNAKDVNGETALTNAAYMCPDASVIEALVRAGAKIDSRTKSNDTALTIAALAGNAGAVSVLLQAGADIEARNADGESALMIAKTRRVGRTEEHDRIVELLERRHNGR
jgi:ankyrin repeat protein